MHRILSVSNRFLPSFRELNLSKNILSPLYKITSATSKQKSSYKTMSTAKVNLMSTSLKPPMIREDPVVAKIDSALFRNVFNDELRTLISIFKQYKYELRIAGGAVRDIISNKKPKDIDLATTATPEEMKAMFTHENVRMINTRGEDHGTITVRINEMENFEITTLRIDTSTDGRHAIVKYTTDWLLDAGRRDLTINSMFLGLDGSLYDYFYGYDDLEKRRVVFVGDANSRIKEDYLRILRYFRFYGRIANNADEHDQYTLEAIRNNCVGLARISGERIWTELQKIFTGKYPKALMLKMCKCDLATYCGLPLDPDLKEFERVCDSLESFSKPNYPILYMIALLHNCDDVQHMHSRLKLSAFDRDLALFITQNRNKVDTEFKILADYKKLCVTSNVKQAFVLELLKYKNKFEYYNDLKKWKAPPFPLSGTVLQQNGVEPGMQMGLVIAELRLIWADNDFNISGEDLIDLYLNVVRNRVGRTMKVKKHENSSKLKKKTKVAVE